MEPFRGLAAGVPYLAVPPANGNLAAPLVIVWHLMDPPRTEVAMAAALPLERVPAWRIYLGLPLSGGRTPAGGFEEIMRLVREDTLLRYLGVSITAAAGELPDVLDALRDQLPAEAATDAPVAVVGGSAGGAAALLALAEAKRPIAAAVLINAAVKATTVVALTERAFGGEYAWSPESRMLAERLDFVARAGELAARSPQPPVLVISGDDDHYDFQADAAELTGALKARYIAPEEVALAKVPGLAHPLAAEPGVEAAAQLPQARTVDALAADWLIAHLGR